MSYVEEFEYRQVLKVANTATMDEIKASYRRLALSHHPDKNPDDPRATEKFRLIQAAYQYFSEKHEAEMQKREEEKRERERYANGYGSSRNNTNNGWTRFEWDNETTKNQKDPPILHPLQVSFEEVLLGGTKKMSITRTIRDNDGKERTETETLNLHLARGVQRGHRIVCKEKGDIKPNRIPADIIFEIHDRPHPHFQRAPHSNADLLYQTTITYRQFISSSFQLEIPTLEGEPIMKSPCLCSQSADSSDHYEFHLPRRGLPKSEWSDQRGDILVRFAVLPPAEGDLIQEEKKEETGEEEGPTIPPDDSAHKKANTTVNLNLDRMLGQYSDFFQNLL